jgi:hypothetical protein
MQVFVFPSGSNRMEGALPRTATFSPAVVVDGGGLHPTKKLRLNILNSQYRFEILSAFNKIVPQTSRLGDLSLLQDRMAPPSFGIPTDETPMGGLCYLNDWHRHHLPQQIQ